MITLLYVNTIVFGVIGVLFSVYGSNAQSRAFGMVGMACAVANVLFAMEC